MKALKWMVLVAAALITVPALARAQPPEKSSRIPTAASVRGACNINTADATQLALLPGIGPARAQAIIAHRQKQPFKSIDEIVRVKGIGRKTFAKLRPYLSTSGPTTLTRGPSHSSTNKEGTGAGQ